MSDRWYVTIEAWAHSTNRGADVDQKDAGERRQCFVIFADGIAKALAAAELIAKGIETNPMVWQAPITSISSEAEHERAEQ